MPTSKRYPRNLKLGLSQCEWAALSWLQKQTGQSVSELIREAVLVFVRHHPQFRADKFEDAASMDLEPQIKDPDLLSFFKSQLHAFTDGVPSKRSSSREDSLPLSMPRFNADTFFKDETKLIEEED